MPETFLKQESRMDKSLLVVDVGHEHVAVGIYQLHQCHAQAA